MEAQRVRLEDDTVAMELRLQQATLEGQLRAEQNNVRQLQGQLAARLESHQVGTNLVRFTTGSGTRREDTI